MGTVTAPGEPDRVVEERPLVAGLREQRTRSPGSTPEATRPLATARNSSWKRPAVTSTQPSAVARLKTATSAASRALVTTSSVRFPVVGSEMESEWRTPRTMETS